jgi:hypothetical protein
MRTAAKITEQNMEQTSILIQNICKAPVEMYKSTAPSITAVLPLSLILTLFPPLCSLWPCRLTAAFMLILHKGCTTILHRLLLRRE